MDFIRFALTHGVVIDRGLVYDKITRCPTVEHPQKKNGAYWFNGSDGWVHNWEVGQETAAWWRDENAKPPTLADRERIDRQRAKMAKDIRDLQQSAARKAARVISECEMSEHNYLKSKASGKAHALAAIKALVSSDYELIVPMRNLLSDELCGYQRIFVKDNKWTKEYLYGTRADLSVLRIGRGSRIIVCEGYATGLSIRYVCDCAKLDVTVIVCFSAGNMLKVCREIKVDLVFADHDIPTEKQIERGDIEGTGTSVAKKCGAPWVCSPVPGEDANDMLQRAGRFAIQQLITNAQNCASV